MAVLEGAAQQLSNGVGLKIWLEVGRDLCLSTYAAPEVPYGILLSQLITTSLLYGTGTTG